MSKEKITIEKSKKINTIETLKEDFKIMGLKEGMTIIVHSSLSSFGWVCGGPIAIINALMDVITPSGNIVMPAHTGEYSDPKYWINPPVPKEWHQVIKDNMPAFDPKTTPCRCMGKIADTFLKYEGVVRSYHPQVSFSAYGKNKDFITENHKLEYGLSDTSPLGRLYDLDAYVLLLGVHYDNNTSFHLGEYRSKCREEYTSGAPIFEKGIRVWKEFKELEVDSDGFDYIGKCFENEYDVVNYEIGNANCKLFSQRECVDFATEFLSYNRD